MNASYTLFNTALGACGIAWNDRGVTAFQLPEVTTKLTEDRISKKANAGKSSKVPSHIASIIKRVQKHLAGDSQDFQDIAVDLEDTAVFSRQVYQICKTIPAGETMTYGDVAKAMKRSAASRAVGQALGRNPIPLIIPCHRVLAAGNKPGGFSAHGGFATKLKMLGLEGVLTEAAGRKR